MSLEPRSSIGVTETAEADSESLRPELPERAKPGEHVQKTPVLGNEPPVGFPQIPGNSPGDVSAAENVRPAQPRPWYGDAIIRQVAEQIQLRVGKGQSEMQLEIKPEHLGPLTLKVSIEDGLVTANFTVARGMVKDILQANLSELRNALEQQGLKVDQFNVMLGGGSDQGHRFSNPYARESFGRQYSRGYPSTQQGEFDSPAAWMALRGTGSRLDFLA